MVDKLEMEKKEITKIPWDKSVWFFDIDDTLIDTAGTTFIASDAIRDTLQAKVGQDKAKQPEPDDLISQIKIKNITHNTVNVYNFNLTFTLEKLIEVKAGLLNL